jgi:hypothetical protein
LKSLLVWSIRICVAVVLLIAVFNKINFARILVAGDSILSHPTLLCGAIAIESFAIAFLLLAKPANACWLTFLLFASFTPFAAWSWFTQTPCGCFGRPELSWLSLPVDLVILTVILITSRLWRDTRDASWSPLSLYAMSSELFRREPIAMGFSCFAAVVGLGLGLSALNKSDSGGAIQFLLADELIGKPWPSFERYEAQLKALREGKWLVLVVRRDCEHCRELVEGLGQVDVGSLPFRVVTLVAGERKWPVLFGKLAIESLEEHVIDWGEQAEPFVASPAAFWIEDGYVIAAKDGDETTGFIIELMKRGLF